MGAHRKYDYYSAPKVLQLMQCIVSILLLNVCAIASYHQGMKGCSAYWSVRHTTFNSVHPFESPRLHSSSILYQFRPNPVYVWFTLFLYQSYKELLVQGIDGKSSVDHELSIPSAWLRKWMLFIAITEECHWDRMVWRQWKVILSNNRERRGKGVDYCVLESAMIWQMETWTEFIHSEFGRMYDEFGMSNHVYGDW